MLKDFHYYITFGAARLAGWSQSEAETIAYASQLVDNHTIHSHHNVEHYGYRGMEYAVINTSATVGEMAAIRSHIDEPAKNRKSAEVVKSIWMPYHFLPGNYRSKNDSRKDARNILQYRGKTSDGKWKYGAKAEKEFGFMCIPKSYLAEEMVNDCNRHRREDHFLEMTGLRMHVLADTVSHAFYSGALDWYMNDVAPQVYDVNTGKYLTGGAPPLEYYESICYCGHARMGSIPDEPYRDYIYYPQWNRLAEQKVKIIHSDSFIFAFRMLIQALYCIKNDLAFRFGQEYTANGTQVIPQLRQILTNQKELKNLDQRCKQLNQLFGAYQLGFSPEYQAGKWLEEHKRGQSTHYVKFNYAALKHFILVRNELAGNGFDIFESFQTANEAELSRKLNKKQNVPLADCAAPPAANEQDEEIDTFINFKDIRKFPDDPRISKFFDF